MTNCASCGFYAKTRRWRDGLGRIHSVCNLCFSTEAAPLLLTPARPPFGNTDTETIGVLMRGLNEILRALRANRRLQPTTDALPPRCMNDHSQNNTSKKSRRGAMSDDRKTAADRDDLAREQRRERREREEYLEDEKETYGKLDRPRRAGEVAANGGEK